MRIDIHKYMHAYIHTYTQRDTQGEHVYTKYITKCTNARNHICLLGEHAYTKYITRCINARNHMFVVVEAHTIHNRHVHACDKEVHTHVHT